MEAFRGRNQTPLSACSHTAEVQIYFSFHQYLFLQCSEKIEVEFDNNQLRDSSLRNCLRESEKSIFTWRVLKTKKVDSKNRAFHQEWTDCFIFILPTGSSKSVCLTMTITQSNVKRHFQTKHRTERLSKHTHSKC